MPDPNQPRLIEVACPLKQASLDSVHEKNVRHGRTANLKPMEIQELADQIGEITNTAVGNDLKIQVRIEIERRQSPFRRSGRQSQRETRRSFPGIEARLIAIGGINSALIPSPGHFSQRVCGPGSPNYLREGLVDVAPAMP